MISFFGISPLIFTILFYTLYLPFYICCFKYFSCLLLIHTFLFSTFHLLSNLPDYMFCLLVVIYIFFSIIFNYKIFLQILNYVVFLFFSKHKNDLIMLQLSIILLYHCMIDFLKYNSLFVCFL